MENNRKDIMWMVLKTWLAYSCYSCIVEATKKFETLAVKQIYAL